MDQNACASLSPEIDTDPDIGDIYTLLDFAKLDVEDLNINIQQVSFAECMEDGQLKLLELDPSTLDEIENGGKLLLKGDDTENCVLCSDNKTFEIKDTGISNGLLLTRGLTIQNEEKENGGKLKLQKTEVKAVKHNYLEMRLVKPKVKPLMTLLKNSAYDGPENEASKTDMLTLENIFCEVQASRGEIMQALDILNVCTLDGFVRLINFDYLTRVLDSIASLLEERSWHFDEFSHNETCEILGDIYPLSIIEHVLKSYGSPKGDDKWELSEDKVCKFYAELLLRPTQKFNLKEFLEAWKMSVPEGMITSLEQIKGIGLVDMRSSPAVMRYFDETLLSEDIKLRFEEMFEVKNQWTVEEATPYIEPLCIGKQTVGVLLTKYARAFNKGGTKYYTSKYIK